MRFGPNNYQLRQREKSRHVCLVMKTALLVYVPPARGANRAAICGRRGRAKYPVHTRPSQTAPTGPSSKSGPAASGQGRNPHFCPTFKGRLRKVSRADRHRARGRPLYHTTGVDRTQQVASKNSPILLKIVKNKMILLSKYFPKHRFLPSQKQQITLVEKQDHPPPPGPCTHSGSGHADP